MAFQFIADEVVTIPAGEVATLTRSVYEQEGSSRAQWVELYLHDVGEATTLALRFDEDPDTGAYEFIPLVRGSFLTIDGFDNIRDLKLKNTGAVAAKLYAQYFQ